MLKKAPWMVRRLLNFIEGLVGEKTIAVHVNKTVAGKTIINLHIFIIKLLTLRLLL
jgi:hypothetical protein